MLAGHAGLSVVAIKDLKANARYHPARPSNFSGAECPSFQGCSSISASQGPGSPLVWQCTRSFLHFLLVTKQCCSAPACTYKTRRLPDSQSRTFRSYFHLYLIRSLPDLFASFPGTRFHLDIPTCWLYTCVSSIGLLSVMHLSPREDGGEFKLYHYDPTIAGAIVIAVSFGFTTAFHVWQLVRTRCWIALPMVVGGFRNSSNRRDSASKHTADESHQCRSSAT